MKVIHQIRIIFFGTLLCSLFSCGGGGGSDSSSSTPTPPPVTNTTQPYEVTVIDGYLSAATVWLDLNDNGEQDSNEPSATSQSEGKATLTVSTDIDPTQFSVLVYAEAGTTFDESLNSTVAQDFLLASPAGETIVTPLTTLIYFKNKSLADKAQAASEVAEELGLTSQDLFEDFIATDNALQQKLAADLVRLELMPTSNAELTNQAANSDSVFENIDEYLELSDRDGQEIFVIRDSNGILSGDTDLDSIADSEDDDIDGDGIPNTQDSEPLIAELYTKDNPGILTKLDMLEGSILEDDWQYFVFQPTKDELLNIQLANISGDVDLYIRESKFPTRFTYLCRSNLSNTQSELCTETVEVGKTYYIALLARQDSAYSLSAATNFFAIKKVVLLLHGLASTPNVWRTMINDDSFFNGSCPTITAENGPLAVGIANKDGTRCFSLKFGTLDRGSDYSVVGLDNVSCDNVSGCKGDYTTFEGLGYEIDVAISRIVATLGSDTELFLFGHSRGGLAARSYLQNPQTNNKANVKGFATTGTPHQGSPFGRFYKRMQDNCIPKSATRRDAGECEDNWEVIEMLNGTRTYFGFDIGLENLLDLHAPSVDFLSSDSEAIQNLNSDLSSLGNLVIGQLIYEGTEFGLLAEDVAVGLDYDLYDSGASLGDHPNDNTLRYIENGQTRESFIGDGIVPSYSQNLGILLEQQGMSVSESIINQTPKILHAEEVKEITDIKQLFDDLYSELEWK